MIGNKVMDHFIEYNVCDELSDYIECIWTEDYFNEYNNRNKEIIILPDNTVELVFSPYTIFRNNIRRNQQIEMASQLVGFKTKPQIIKVGNSPIITVRFKPQALYYFTRYSMGKTIDQCLSPDYIFGQDYKDFETKLFQVNTLDFKVQLIEKYLKFKLLQIDKKRNTLVENTIRSIGDIIGVVDRVQLEKELKIRDKKINIEFIEVLGLSLIEYFEQRNLFEAIRNINVLHNDKLNILGYKNHENFEQELRNVYGIGIDEAGKIRNGIQKSLFE